jgi:hypothetical protein
MMLWEASLTLMRQDVQIAIRLGEASQNPMAAEYSLIN